MAVWQADVTRRRARCPSSSDVAGYKPLAPLPLFLVSKMQGTGTRLSGGCGVVSQLNEPGISGPSFSIPGSETFLWLPGVSKRKWGQGHEGRSWEQRSQEILDTSRWV